MDTQPTRDRQPGKRRLLAAGVSAGLLAIFAVFVVADRSGSENAPRSGSSQLVPFIDVDGLSTELTADRDDLLLVEFGVLTGCDRCDQMRDGLDGLARDEKERLTVRRVDIRRHPELAWEFGVTVCPSYVAFRRGVEVYRAAYPTSADRVKLGLDGCSPLPSSGAPLLVAQ